MFYEWDIERFFEQKARKRSATTALLAIFVLCYLRYFGRAVAAVHWTRQGTSFSLASGVLEVVMTYEWDVAKARRAYLIKFAVACVAAVVLAIVPVWFAFKAGAIGSAFAASVASSSAPAFLMICWGGFTVDREHS